jgi:hypothetical protein
MDNKKVLGFGVVAASAAMIGGLIYYSSNYDHDRRQTDDEAVARQEASGDGHGWDDYQDANRYSFCSGQAVISNNYSNPALGNTGKINYSSKELLLFDKQARKFLCWLGKPHMFMMASWRF